MVKRCAFYVRQCKLIQRNVSIDWNLGFDKEAKHAYIKQMQGALSPYVRVVDVTTASPIWEARGLSPFYVKVSEQMSVEDGWKILQQKAQGKLGSVDFDFFYLSHLSEEQIQYVIRTDGFIDVFHNPDKACNTQARSLACLQLLYLYGKTDYLKEYKWFREWYLINCMNAQVIEEV